MCCYASFYQCHLALFAQRGKLTFKGGNVSCALQKPFRTEAPLLMEIFQQIYRSITATELAEATEPVPQPRGQHKRPAAKATGSAGVQHPSCPCKPNVNAQSAPQASIERSVSSQEPGHRVGILKLPLPSGNKFTLA